MRFPDFYPDGCPPDTAEYIDKYVYRYTNSNPPCEDDFLSAFQMGKFRRSTSVQKYGLSVNSCIDNAKNAIGLVPALREYNYIAGGFANAVDGPLEFTPRQKITKHMTWYLHDNVNPYSKFEVIEDL